MDTWHAPRHRQKNFARFQYLAKRALDLLGALCGLIIGAPVMTGIALAILLDSPGPVLYSTYRVGKKGRLFRFYKFRTMVGNAEELLDEVRDRSGQQILLKFHQDPRITGVGRFLRCHSLDEMPQFWNILKGDMSMVGPRPPSLSEYEQLRGEDHRRMSVLPGLTGLWQVAARGDPSFETYVRLDCQYVDQWSLWLDLRIVLKTIPAVLAGTGQ